MGVVLVKFAVSATAIEARSVARTRRGNMFEWESRGKETFAIAARLMC
jgi:hypothetical protein